MRKLTPQEFIDMAEHHRAADMLAQRSFEFNGKSCSIGCFNHDLGQVPGSFRALSQATGIPIWAHRLQERIFEGLDEKRAINWHVDFAVACSKVKDWVEHYHKVMIGILELALPYDESGSVQRVIALHVNYRTASLSDWRDVRNAADAYAAAAYAAYAAADAGCAAADAADAAYAAASEAARAAARAADAYADAAAYAASYLKIADIFLNTAGENG